MRLARREHGILDPRAFVGEEPVPERVDPEGAGGGCFDAEERGARARLFAGLRVMVMLVVCLMTRVGCAAWM